MLQFRNGVIFLCLGNKNQTMNDYALFPLPEVEALYSILSTMDNVAGVGTSGEEVPPSSGINAEVRSK